uniref:AM-toxin biosynthesis protein 11 n=1 Tax=Alternaria alternata TaxID=5599 RepID=AMT11_ALTAL|nr:RecName: Full=AM-toxin biosynthesis protein 11 [Alternaria alternata]BAI44747.1 hypothetical protein [Alternaria alternata]
MRWSESVYSLRSTLKPLFQPDSPLTLRKRNKSLCEYNIRRSRRRPEEESIQSLSKHVSTTTQPCPTDGRMMFDLSNPYHSSETVVGRDAEGPANPLDTPFSEFCFSQLVSNSAHSYLDFDLFDEPTPGTNQAQTIEPGQQTSGFENPIPYHTHRNDTPILDWSKLDRYQSLHQHSAAQFYDSLGTEQDDSAARCTLALFSGRIVADKAETNPFLIHKTHRTTVLLQNAHVGGRRQQAVLDKCYTGLGYTSLGSVRTKAR